MRKLLEGYVIEITLALLGAVAAALEAIFVHRSDIALLLAFTSVLLALAVVAIRQEIARRIGDALEDRQIIENIPDSLWRAEAQAEIERARVKFASWASGTRRVDEHSSLNFQIESLRRATRSVRAVHLALDKDSLTMWDNRQRGFDRLVDAYRALPDHVQRRRILVLDAADETLSSVDGGQRIIVDELTKRVCLLQMATRDDGGLGFELRISWTHRKSRDISDMLIIDDREVCSIESYGHGQFGDLEVCVNSSTVGYQIHRFEDLWTDSVPVRHCLPQA